MPQECSICRRRDRRAINQAIVNGESTRSLAKRYKVVRSTMARHARHVPMPPEKEVAPMKPPTIETPGTVDDDTMHAWEVLRAELAEAHTQLARTQAQLAGINREFAAWRSEQAAQRAQCADDHVLVEQLRAWLQILYDDAPSWQMVESFLRSDGRNGKGPLRQSLRRLVGRPELPFYG